MIKRPGQFPTVTFVFLSLISLLLILSNSLNIFGPFYRATETLALPLKTSLHRLNLTLGSWWATLLFFRSGEERIKELELKVVFLQSQLVSLKSLENENEILRKQVGLVPQRSRQFLLANVIGLSEFLLLDVGAADGVKKDQVVVLGKILLGQVLTVSQKSAQVRLLTHPESKIPVEIYPAKAQSLEIGPKARGLAVGQFGKTLDLQGVPQGNKLVAGDLVVSSSTLSLPQGLLVGEVSFVEVDPTASFQKARLKPALDSRLLEKVFLLVE